MITHCKNPHDIYIGRPKSGGEWNYGNPFVIGRDGSRQEVIEKDRQWLIFGRHYENKDATPARRRWILSNLDKLKGILTYGAKSIEIHYLDWPIRERPAEVKELKRLCALWKVEVGYDPPYYYM